jgi:hypothetical protein
MTGTTSPRAPGTDLVRGIEPSALAPVAETSTAAAVQMARSAYETRLIMARQFPRAWDAVKLALFGACDRPEFAADALYALERGKGDKKTVIEGLTVRFAEEAARAMGNLLVEARVVYDDLDKRIITVSITDLEVNLTWPTDVVVDKTVERSYREGREVVSSRLNAQGNPTYRVRATDDEVMLKQNSLVSKAARNGILRFLSSDLQEAALARVKATLQEPAKPSVAEIKRLLAGFKQVGVTPEALQGYLGRQLAEMTGREFAEFRALWNAIKDGETTWEAVAQAAPPTARRRAPAVRDAQGGYGGPAVAAPAAARAPRPVEPRMQTQAAPDDYHCDHGVPMTDPCEECRADAESEAGINP